MRKKAFIPLALLPLAGSKPEIVDKIIHGHKIDADFKKRLTATRVAAILSKPFHAIETLKYQKKIEHTALPQHPLFILGHWRSGTTFLHNLLSKDPQYGYVTTYHSVFPLVTLSGKWLYRNFMQLAMPDKRPADNVKLSTIFPQEEEFALSNIHGMSFYNFWYFPTQTKTLFDKYLTFDDLSEHDIEVWKNNYIRLVQTAMLNTQSHNVVLKNPPSTGRIKTILQLFPEAKFIHICRNPVIVFLSTLRFFEKTLPSLQLQQISKEDFIENILWVYTKLMHRYELEKSLIPEENLIEFKFEDFSRDPLLQTEHIYQVLNLKGFDTARPHFEKYLDTQKKFKMNTNQISKKLLDDVLDRWGYFMNKYDYNIPENISILEK